MRRAEELPTVLAVAAENQDASGTLQSSAGGRLVNPSGSLRVLRIHFVQPQPLS